MIREQDPLKQGLKLKIFFGFMKEFPIREQDPLKQGLKQGYKGRNQSGFGGIREQDPLKQGLKHQIIPAVPKSFISIREQDPLKQGLKLLDLSNRTRAQTYS